jgi:hypothetical protein
MAGRCVRLVADVRHQILGAAAGGAAFHAAVVRAVTGHDGSAGAAVGTVVHLMLCA